MAGPRDLTTAVLRFGHMLRAAGLPLTIGEMMDGVRALEAVDLLDRRDVYLALRTTLVARHEEFPAFDRCFEAFWRFHAEEGQGLDGLMTPAEAAIPEEHAGNTGGLNGGLDSLDDRLYAAMIRNGRLWTAHNFRVSAAGVANTAAQSRNASRWYEFQNLTTTPTVVQSGTVFDNAAPEAAAEIEAIADELETFIGKGARHEPKRKTA